MKISDYLSIPFGFVLGMSLSSAQADELFADDVIVFDDLLCVGFNCLLGEAAIPGRSGLKLNDQNMAILFEDNSTTGPTTDWQITINGTTGNAEFFKIEDITNATSPFLIGEAAPTNALYIDDGGNIGLGTELPSQDIHIVHPVDPGIRLERTSGGGFTPGIWDVANSLQGFQLSDQIASTTPFSIQHAAPDNALLIRDTGNVGLGESAPDGKLHTNGDGVQLVYFESGDGGPVQVRFRTDSENRRFLAVNNANEVKSQIIFLDDRINFTGQTDSGANLWLSIGPDGITSQGPTCGSPCDLTFDPDVFEVPPIEVRAEYMWDNMHLPAIGPTSPDQPINLTEKTGGIIHELEVAHIYIEQLHARLDAQEALLRTQDARLRALEQH